MGSGFATVAAEDGIVARSADVNGFTVAELRFAPGYVQPEFEPELPYLALVLEGNLEKSFRLRTMHLDRACAVTMPSGAGHGARFGSKGARIVIVRPKRESSPAARSLDRVVESSHGLQRRRGRVRCRMQVQYDIRAAQGVEGELAHTDLEEVGGIEQPGQIVEDVLGIRAGVGADAGHRQAGGLGPRAHDGQVLADEGVQERRLADVGRAGERDVAAMGHASI